MKTLHCPFCGSKPTVSEVITMGNIVEYCTCDLCNISLPSTKWQVRLSEGDTGLIAGLQFVLTDLKEGKTKRAESYITNLLDSHNLL